MKLKPGDLEIPDQCISIDTNKFFTNLTALKNETDGRIQKIRKGLYNTHVLIEQHKQHKNMYILVLSFTSLPSYLAAVCCGLQVGLFVGWLRRGVVAVN